MTATDPLAYLSEKAEADARQLAMLRHTLSERIAHAEERLASVGGDIAIGLWSGRASAYRDVLSLLGPEEPTDTSEEPF